MLYFCGLQPSSLSFAAGNAARRTADCCLFIFLRSSSSCHSHVAGSVATQNKFNILNPKLVIQIRIVDLWRHQTKLPGLKGGATSTSVAKCEQNVAKHRLHTPTEHRHTHAHMRTSAADRGERIWRHIDDGTAAAPQVRSFD